MSFYYPEESCPKGRTVLISISWNGCSCGRPIGWGAVTHRRHFVIGQGLVKHPLSFQRLRRRCMGPGNDHRDPSRWWGSPPPPHRRRQTHLKTRTLIHRPQGHSVSGRRSAVSLTGDVVQRFLYGEETTQAQILRPAVDRSPGYRSGRRAGTAAW